MLLVPELERIFFEDEALLQGLIGRALTDAERLTARYEPRAVLEGIIDYPAELEKRLGAVALERLVEVPAIRDLVAFVRGTQLARTGS